jgi:hypothetical protein
MPNIKRTSPATSPAKTKAAIHPVAPNSSSPTLRARNVAEVLPLTCAELKAMSETSRTVLAEMAIILKNNRGNITPAEEFILGLVMRQAIYQDVTPDDVEGMLEDFRADMRDAIDTCRYMNRSYPKLIAGTDVRAIEDKEAV